MVNWNGFLCCETSRNVTKRVVKTKRCRKCTNSTESVLPMIDRLLMVNGLDLRIESVEKLRGVSLSNLICIRNIEGLEST